MTIALLSLMLPLVSMPQDPQKLATTSTNGLAVDLYGRLAAGAPDTNLFLSPWSIATALAMTAEGAGGDTLAEMRRTLHLGDGGLSDVHASFAALQQSLTAGSGSLPEATRTRIAALRAELAQHNAAAERLVGANKYREAEESQTKAERTARALNELLATADCYELRAANALWCDRGSPLLPTFLATLGRHYGTGGANLVDFRGNPEGVRGTINGWVADRTEQRILDLIPQGCVTSDTRLVLTNAVWFRGEWKTPFEASQTNDAVFTHTNGQTTTVRLMHDGWRADVPYAAFTGTGEYFDTPEMVPSDGSLLAATYPDADGFQIAELPYKGGDLAMVVLLPRRHDGLAKIERLLTADNLANWLGNLERREVDTALPRFQQRSDFRLGMTLRGLGMGRAFTPPTDTGGAQFEGINGATEALQKLFIGEVVHQAFVEVSEKGTEAAAATAVMMACGAAAPPPVEMVPFKPVFRADRPFLFLIRDTKSGAILFLGRVHQPTKAV
ncbi:MAG: hypothetical protein JNK15_07790 [Planctomycetes bacterium]|nr:hypothetical protein [Planctomycetota bacterium]